MMRAGALAHDALADDEGGLALHGLGLLDGGADLGGVVAVDDLHVPTEGAVLGGRVLIHDDLGLRGELDVVGVVEHHEVVQTQRTGDTGSALGDFLLHATVGDVGVDGFLREARVAGVGSQELGGDGGAHGVGVALAEGTGGVLDAARRVKLGVTGGRGAPLAQVGQLFEAVFADQAQLGVEHRGHVAGIQEETVAGGPGRVAGIVGQILAVEHVDEIGATHGTARVSGFGFFDCTGRQDADVVGCVIENADRVCHLNLCFWFDYFQIVQS